MDQTSLQRLSAVLAGIALVAGVAPHANAEGEFEQGRTIERMGHVLPPRERVEPVNRMLQDRLDNLLPQMMRETGIDLWLVINREYVEDPVYLTLVPEPVFAARRTTMLVFHDRGGDAGVERLTVSRYALAGVYDPAWSGGTLDEQWERLAEILTERDPKKIGINVSRHWPFGDGLTAGLRDRLEQALPKKLRERLTSAEALCVRWLETRTALELEAYPNIVGLARRVIAEAFSDEVITPGVTTTKDLYWYIRERFEALNLRPWFQPYVNVQRRGQVYQRDDPFFGLSDTVIQRGDVLHTDVGICYLRLCTDTQEMGYVLRLGEDDVPAGLKRALADGNRWQDLLTGSFETGRSGNEVLALTAQASAAAGIRSATYTHPIGFYGHAAGPTIGMWDNQGPTAERGEWQLRPSTAYAIEGNIVTRVPEWDDQWVQIKLEQSALFDGARVLYLAGRQTEWHVVQ